MSDKKSNDSRRKLLKSIAAGSGAVVAGKSLPESWSKPVINSVVLPVHAETTDDNESGGPEATTTPAPCVGDCNITSVVVNTAGAVPTVTLNGSFCLTPLVTVNNVEVPLLSTSSVHIVFDVDGFTSSGTYTIVVDCGCTCSDSYTIV